ncbi:hypothetical protein DpV83gp052 [Deerpox virus W-848-83]|uniref:IMV membrane protein n=1 Tax=Deerpox virus (strain Mule deer/United States/W-848-83/1983) TaxID=305674 RepID=Q08FV0_DPV83|nr:hypothetical protein DpV83gp052 [Deerpox virus W-848-83]ABI99207.1 hypothetical protein DpV83gp052 [Deerpox virus W-848-83]
MDKLYAAIFGVFMSSTDDDFNNFIDVVKSVLSDEDGSKKTTKSVSWFNSQNFLFLIFSLIIVSLFSFFVFKGYTRNLNGRK